jgi:hypothetical protein
MFVARSPAQDIIRGNILLHKHTWYGKIQRWRPEVEFFQVQDTLEAPDIICESRTRAPDWVFYCEGNTNDYGEGMRVTVRHEGGVNFVTNAYYSDSSFHGHVLWRRGDG